MNNSNPLIPQGSLQEQEQIKKRHHFKVAILCVFAFSAISLGGMLFIGCKPPKDTTPQDTSAPPLVDTNLPTVDTNTPVLSAPPLTTAPSNPVVAAPVPAPAPIPTPAPMPTPAPASSGSEYVVAHGDSFYSIGKKYGVSMKAIEAANPGVVPTKLKVGQKLEIPGGNGGSSSSSSVSTGAAPMLSSDAGEIYVVKSGDTLTKIAKSHGTTVRAMQAANDLKTFKIKVGQKLKLPATASAPAPAPAPEPTPMIPTPAPAPAPLTAPAPAPGH